MPTSSVHQSIEFYSQKSPSLKSRLLKKVFQIICLKRIMNMPRITRHLIPLVHTPTPLSRLKRKYTLNEQQVDHRRIFTLIPKTPVSTTILYLHGGAFVLNMTTPHWQFIDQLITHTSSTVVVPDYPLLPESTYKDRLDLVEKIYLELSSEVGGHHLILMGDSSGGNIALALAQRIKTKGLAPPAQVILLSPWLDVSMSNKAILPLIEKDPMLSYTGAIVIGQQHAGKEKTTHPEVSPIYGPLKGIGTLTVFTGTHDLLHPDAKKLYELAKEQGVDIHYYEYSQMMHAWMLFDLPESKLVLKQLIELIKQGARS